MTNPMRTMYCEECRGNVPVEELEDGTVIIHCPKCTGECFLCDCHLAVNCFASATNVVIRHFEPNSEKT